jgi:g-D-glutamyl-meso-diaminopimelate peptidase
MEVTVQKGDTFFRYSRLFCIHEQLIADSNPTMDPQCLKIGEKVKIPGFVVKRYRIKKEDTLWQLATERFLSPAALQTVNPNIDLQHLRPGSEIFIPKRVINLETSSDKPYDSKRLEEEIQRIAAIYPFVRVQKIGESVDQKPIWELKIGKGNKKIHMNGSFHANEWITTVVLITFIKHFLLSLTNHCFFHGIQAYSLYPHISLSIVPMVNPDGVDLVLNGPPESKREELIKMNGGNKEFLKWKANIRGVDLNNQYPANWEIEKIRKKPKSPAPRDYPGNKPLSEPEAIAMAELAKKEKFDRVLALHTQGKEIYWGYEGKEPEEAEFLAKWFSRMSGYKSVRYVDSHAGFKDWFIQEFGKAGFTIELGKGLNPLPPSQWKEIYRDVSGILLCALLG